MAPKKKKVMKMIKVQITGGKANPAPPVGPALGQAGVNIMDFCKNFNERTKDQVDTIIPVVITVYEDKSYTFVTKTPPASVLIKKVLKLPKGSSEPNKIKPAEITWKQCEEIAQMKTPDLNATDVKAGARIIAGTAKSMGIDLAD